MFMNKLTDHFAGIRCLNSGILVFTVMLFGWMPVAVHAFDLLIGTDESGTFSHFTGRTLCRVINSEMADVNCTVMPGADEINHLTNVQGGSLDMALIDTHLLYDAFNKTGPFEFLDINYANLRTLAPLYDIPYSLIVRDDAAITSLNDLKGKRFNAGPAGSSQRLAVEALLKAKSWSRSDFTLFDELPPSQSQDTMAFCHGTIQAILHTGVHPDPVLQQLFTLCNARMVSVFDDETGKMVAENAAFWETDIAADAYPAVPEAIKSFGTRVVLVVSEDFDAATARKIVELIYIRQDRLKSAHPALTLFEVADVKESAADMRLHPGADGYFSTND